VIVAGRCAVVAAGFGRGLAFATVFGTALGDTAGAGGGSGKGGGFTTSGSGSGGGGGSGTSTTGGSGAGGALSAASAGAATSRGAGGSSDASMSRTPVAGTVAGSRPDSRPATRACTADTNASAISHCPRPTSPFLSDATARHAAAGELPMPIKFPLPRASGSGDEWEGHQ
jgi:hypothetical protein